jgi:hypothetical protein
VKRQLVYLISILICSSAAFSQEMAYQSFFSSSQSFDSDGTELYRSNLELKKHKKVGLGIAFGGVNGNIGANAELNLDPMTALVIGMGTGPSYGTFNLQAKLNFEAYYLSPFIKMGYSRWFSSGSLPSQAGNSDILRQVYTDAELRAGKFDAGFLVSSLGAEYNQLEGELSGLNFYGEVTMMADTKNYKLIPAGSVGLTYFY